MEGEGEAPGQGAGGEDARAGVRMRALGQGKGDEGGSGTDPGAEGGVSGVKFAHLADQVRRGRDVSA